MTPLFRFDYYFFHYDIFDIATLLLISHDSFHIRHAIFDYWYFIAATRFFLFSPSADAFASFSAITLYFRH